MSYIDFFSSLTDWVPEDLPLTEESTIFWNSLPPKAIKKKISENDGDSIMKDLYEEIVKQLASKKGKKSNCENI